MSYLYELFYFLGCSKCLKSFPINSSNLPDYSGFDTSTWITRNGVHHKEMGESWLNCRTNEEKKQIQFDCGVRYSELFRLPYFDPIKMHVIGPMHNLMLGVAKHIFKIWINLGYLNDEKLCQLDERMNRMKIPSDIGRITRSMSKGYKNMKADEWKHWTLIYSIFSLQGILDKRDINIWSLFANGYSLLFKRSISINKLEECHNLFKLFCNQVKERYGSKMHLMHSKCISNMHLILHIKECILNYGPVYAIWCFGFEQFNGIMEKYHVNNRSTEIQIMRKFTLGCKLYQFIDDDSGHGINNEIETDRKKFTVRGKQNVVGADLEFVSEHVLSIGRQTTISQYNMDKIGDCFKSFYEEDFAGVSLFVIQYTRISFMNQIIASNTYRVGKSPYSFVFYKISRMCR